MNTQSNVMPTDTNKYTLGEWLTIISAFITVISALTGAGFAAGKKYTEVQNSAQSTELKAEITILQGKLDLAQLKLNDLENSSTTKIKELNEGLVEWKKAYDDLRMIFDQKNGEISVLSKKLNGVDSCSFIQKQILETREEIDNVRSVAMWSEVGSLPEQIQNRITVLEKRLTQYQQELGACAR